MADKVDQKTPEIPESGSESAQWQVQVSKIGAFSNFLIRSEVLEVASSRHLKIFLDRKKDKLDRFTPSLLRMRARGKDMAIL